MSKSIHILAALAVIAFVLCAPAASLMAQEAAEAAPAVQEAAEAVAQEAAASHGNAIYFAIAIAVGVGCLSSAYAVGKVGAAVMGAAAEKPEILGKAIAFVGLGEGIALFGFLIAIFLFTKI